MKQRRNFSVVEEVMHPAAAVAAGIVPILPLPVERHKVVRHLSEAEAKGRAKGEGQRAENPSTQHPAPSTIVSSALAVLTAKAPRRVNPGFARRFRADLHASSHRVTFLGKYRCKHCHAQFKTGREAIEHLNDKHGATYRLKPPSKAWQRRNPRLVCTHCGSSQTASNLSEVFHGTPRETAIVDRRGKKKTVLDMGRLVEVKTNAGGEVTHIVYEPDRHSQRGGAEWDHRSGDRGLPFGLGDSDKKPHLVVDPATRRPELAMGSSPMKFDPRRGLVA